MSIKTNVSEERLASGPIIKTMLSLGIPAFIAQFINLLYNIVDRIYIGHIEGEGAMALTGLGVCFPIITLVAAFASLVGAGGSPLAGIALGKGDREKAERIVGDSAAWLVVLSIVLTVLFQFIKEPFLRLFGASDVTYPYAEKYLTIYLCGTIFVMLTLGMNQFITAQGQAMTAMVTVVIGAVLNLVLDPVFIFAFDMGVSGAAIATVISQAVSALWVMKFLTSEKASLKLKRKYFRISRDLSLKIAALGVSPFIMAVTESLITIIYNRGAAIYGNDLYVGSITILQSTVQIILVPVSGFSHGVAPMISYNFGAGNLDRVKKVCRTLIIWLGTVALALSLCFMLAPGVVAGCFTDDRDLIEICRGTLPIFVAGMTVFGLQSACQSCFMALGKAKQAFFFAVLRKVILLTPLALILPAAMGDILGLYLAEPISDGISATTCAIVFLISIRKLEKE